MADKDILLWLENELPSISRKQQILAYSCGADATASLIRMRQWGLDPELVYFYFIPDLPMVDNYLKYIEDKFGKQVHRMPGKLSVEYYLNGLLQRPMIGERMFKALKKQYAIPKTSDINSWLLECFDDPLMAVGLRVSDGIFRAKLLREKGPVNWDKKEWYPVADCYRSDIVKIIKDAGVKLPVDYKLFGRSFESIREWTAPEIKKKCPKTWAKVIEHFPMANLLCAQHSFFSRSKDITSRITSYGGLAFSNEDCTL